MKKAIILMLLALFLSNTIFSQEKIVKEEGWKLPDISNLRSKSETEKNIDGITVKISEIDLEDLKPTIFVSSVKENESKSEMFWEVRKAVCFSVNDKIFAYTFHFVPFAVEEQTQGNKTFFVKSYIGVMLQYHYFDEDGDGKFETRSNLSDLKINPPDWVRNLN